MSVEVQSFYSTIYFCRDFR